MLLLVLTVFCTIALIAKGQDMTTATCSATTGHFAVTEPDANVVIGALLNVRSSGQGMLGCGSPTSEGIQLFEALRWTVRLLNQDTGELNGKPISESFVPGVKFGLQTYDSCEHSELAVKYMTELFPVLKSGQESCDILDQNSTRMIGMVDATGVSGMPRVMDAVKKHVIPVIPLNHGTLIPPEQMAKVLAEVVHDLDWEKVAIFHADDEYSIYVTKVFGQLASNGYPCIVGINSFPSTIKMNENVQSLHKIVNSLAAKLSDKSAILVIGNGKVLSPFIDELKNSPHFERLQWLFSWVPSLEEFSELVRTRNSNNVFSLSLYPKEVEEFESYWSKLQDLAYVSSTNDHWFLEYAMSQKNCRISGYRSNVYNNYILCENLAIEELPMDVLMRTLRFMPAFHSVLNFAYAYRKAWAEKCLEVPGVCTDLATMTRLEFVEKFLEPLEFEHAAEFRSPAAVKGQKTTNSVKGEIEGASLALNMYTFIENHGLNFRQVLVYDSQEAKVLDETFHYIPSVCPKGGCKDCISIRQSRFDDLDNDILTNDDYITVAGSEDLIIPILLPIHESGKSPMSCSEKINLEAVKNLEAALWAIEQINSDPQYLPGVKLGTVIIDTCSSPLKLTQKLSSFLMDIEKKGLDDLSSALTFIMSGSSKELLAASSLITPLNITLVSIKDSLRLQHVKEGLLQVPVPLERKTQAIADTLKYLGWNFISVVYDKYDQNMESFKAFKKSARSTDICIATELQISGADDIEMDYVVSQIVDAKSKGSNALIMWTSESVTNAFLKALKRAVTAGAVNDNDLVIIGVDKWIDDFKSFEGSNNNEFGLLVFKTEHSEISDFTNFFKRLQPDNNIRNPWFKELWDANNKQCFDKSCISSETSTWDIIQAVLAISTGVARLRHDICRPEPGICLRMLQQSHLRNMLYKYILESASKRLDIKDKAFTFTESGYGNLTVNIYAFKKGEKSDFKYQKIGAYHNHQVDLLSTSAYIANGKEVMLDKVTSECIKNCSICGKKTTDFLVLESPDHLYLSAAMGIHKSSSNPLSCGSVDSSSGIQSLESFLWALDEINASPQILPGITLGAVIFDSCNSKEKAARDVSNFLSSSLSSQRMPDMNQVFAFISTQDDGVVQSVTDVTMPFKMLTIATDVTSTKFGDKTKYPYLLRASLPNNVIADGIIDMLKHFQWNYVSVIYTSDVLNQKNLFEVFKKKAEDRDIQLAMADGIAALSTESFMKGIIQKLQIKQEEGSKIVILLLNAQEMSKLFSVFSKQHDVDASNFVWISVGNVEVFHKYPDVSLGALMIQTNTPTIIPFRQYFENLNLKNNSRNPWFKEYWEQIFKCHGVSCYNESLKNRMQFVQDPTVPRTINSVLTIGVALETLRQQLCPGLDREMCSAIKGSPSMRDLLFNITQESSFMGADGTLFKFSNLNYAARNLEMFNFRQVGSNVRAFVAVGNYSPDEGLSMNYSRVKFYDKQGAEFSMYDIKSLCNSSLESCIIANEQTEIVMQILPKQEFAINAIMPIHQKGNTFFACGKLGDKFMFQNLAAITYALKKINSDTNILPGIDLGLLVFDYCTRKEKAEEQMYAFFSNKLNNIAKITPRSVIGSVTYGEETAMHLAPIFDAAKVTQIAAPTGDTAKEERDENIIYFIPSMMSQVQVLLSISRHFGWEYLNLIYSDTDFGRSGYYHFSKSAKDIGICIANAVLLESDNTAIDIEAKLIKGFTNADAKIVVVLIDDFQLAEKLTEAVEASSVLHRYVWLASESWGANSRLLKDVQNNVNIITIRIENENDPEFQQYLINMSPRKHASIPSEWFDEFWQHHFHCQLPNSLVIQKQYTSVCNGKERLSFEKFTQSKYIYHTIKVINGIATGLHNYLIEKCPHQLAAMSIDDCGINSKEDLKIQIEQFLTKKDPECEECGPLGSIFGYDVYQTVPAMNNTFTYKKIGSWKDGLLFIDNPQIDFISGHVPESICKTDCYRCINQLGQAETLLAAKESIYFNFKEIWGIAVAVMSVLGVILVIICALYFLMSFPVTIGTTVLGYMILFGLLLLYSVNFSFIISPTAATCGVRRFGLGLAYAIIFSGMLVKVMNTWRLMGYNGSRILNDGTRLSSPTGLLVIAIGLVIIQIVLSAAWLILMPPQIGAYEMGWRCAPPTTFEEGLVVSLVYVMLLLAITTLFAILTWQCQDNNRESRWILACSTLVAVVWLTWTILSTQLSPHHRDMTIAVANLTNATIIMVCLYLRKVYLFSKLTRQAVDQDIKTHLQPSAYTHSLYGSSVKSGPFSTLAPVLYGSQASLNGKKLYNGPSSRLELINCPEDNKSDSSGSVQVQAADLYPLDMYDGGSQFQPVSSLYGSNHTLVLDDTLTFGR